MRDAYDVIVVGAGPAGSVAARKFAETGYSTLLIEKRQEIGVPVRCAEAVGQHSTEVFIPIDEKWVRAHISHYSVVGTDLNRVTVRPSEPTLIVDRKVFDWELAHLAAKAGAEVRTRTQANGLMRDAGGNLCAVRISSGAQHWEVRTKLVIAADGTESQVARWAGLKTVPPMSDYYSGFQYLLGNIGGKITSNICEYHLGNSQAPGGYLWVFPKGEDVANVGIVITADRAAEVSAQTWVDRFVEKHFPNAARLGAVAGGIPATGALKKMVADGVMAVGDAAHQADPLTAGGIGLGMFGAEMAAQVGIKALESGDLSAKALSEYETLWHQRFGKMHNALYSLRKMVAKMEDERLDGLIHTASSLPLEEMSLGQIVMSLFRHHPLMLVQAQVLIMTGLIMK